jgi:hypothetical protein
MRCNILSRILFEELRVHACWSDYKRYSDSNYNFALKRHAEYAISVALFGRPEIKQQERCISFSFLMSLIRLRQFLQYLGVKTWTLKN